MGVLRTDEAAADGSPVPLAVDGGIVPSFGTTVVRWIYPLGADPPAWPEAAEADAAGDGAGDTGAAGGRPRLGEPQGEPQG